MKKVFDLIDKFRRNNPINKFLCWLDNSYEEFTHWYWNCKPHAVKCIICNKTIHSFDDDPWDSFSPEESGWMHIRNGLWICHQCAAHRIFTPDIIKLASIEECLRLNDVNKKHLKMRKNKILEGMKENV